VKVTPSPRPPSITSDHLSARVIEQVVGVGVGVSGWGRSVSPSIGASG